MMPAVVAVATAAAPSIAGFHIDRPVEAGAPSGITVGRPRRPSSAASAAWRAGASARIAASSQAEAVGGAAPNAANRALTSVTAASPEARRAIVWATARAQDCLLVTRNQKDFPADEPGVRQPYTL